MSCDLRLPLIVNAMVNRHGAALSQPHAAPIIEEYARRAGITSNRLKVLCEQEFIRKNGCGFETYNNMRGA